MQSANDVKGVHDAARGRDLEKHEQVQVPTQRQSSIRSRWSRFRLFVGLVLGYELLKFTLSNHITQSDISHSWAYSAFKDEAIRGEQAEELFLYVKSFRRAVNRLSSLFLQVRT